MYIKRFLKLLTIVLLPLAVQLFASTRHKMRPLKEVVVHHQSDDLYVTEEAVKRNLFKDPQAITPVGLLRLGEMENLLDNNVMIEKSQVYCTIDGVLNAKIKQRQPIARVYREGRAFYMDEQGKEMPLSASFSARVPILRGDIRPSHWQPSYELMTFIKNDPWMAENITEVAVKPNGEYEFLMRVPHFRVLFGTFEEAALKKANLKAFYKQLEKTGKLGEYSVVNLKYTNQVVCTR